MNKILSILEHQVFGQEEIESCLKKIGGTLEAQKEAKKIFEDLCHFAQDERNTSILGFYRHNKLKAKNYVGIIQAQNGFTLEILPKIAKNTESKTLKCQCLLHKPYKSNPQKHQEEIQNFYQNLIRDHCSYSPIQQDSTHPNNTQVSSLQCTYCHSKNVFFNCLKTLKNTPFKVSHFSTLKTHKLPLLEVFILMFLEELNMLIQKGIKSDYVSTQENRNTLKGKLLFSEQIRYNLTHKERFFTQSDAYLSDIPPNKLISSTLLKLSKCTLSAKTSQKLNQIRFIFSNIPPSTNPSSDFARCTISRHLRDYRLILQWCKLFLENQSFMQDSGINGCQTLLFDMNKLFESFVAYHLKKQDSSIRIQNSQKYLIQDSQNNNGYQLKPDLWIKDQNIICDTKWKLIGKENEKDLISQADLYQMLAYATKFRSKKIALIYPLCKTTQSLQEIQSIRFPLTFKADKEIKVFIYLFPLDYADAYKE